MTNRRDIIAFCEELHQDLGVRWLDTLKHEHLIACFLDPRFKGLQFLTDFKTRRVVRDLVASKLDVMNPKEYKARVEPVVQQDNLSDLEKRLNDQVDDHADNELIEYNDLPKLHIKSNPLTWWREHQNKFPKLGNFLLTLTFLFSSVGEALSLHYGKLCSVREVILPCWELGHETPSLSELKYG